MTQTPGAPRELSVVVLSRSGAAIDNAFVQHLETAIKAQGHQVVVDRASEFNITWAKEVERRIRTADAVIAVVSSGSLQSEMFSYEVELASEASQKQNGKPKLWLVKLEAPGFIPEALEPLLDSPSTIPCSAESEFGKAVETVVANLQHLATQPVVADAGAAPKAPPLRVAPRPALRPRPITPQAPSQPTPQPTPLQLEPVGGAVPLESTYYVLRQTDAELRNALIRGDSIILIKGARQMGKTSLLARGLQQARERGAKIVLNDFQKFNSTHLSSPDALYFTLAEGIAEQLNLDTFPQDTWDDRRGANVNFERYLRRAVLSKLNAPLVWGLDEVDRLFTCPFGSEVFGLFRSWHNERALDPSGPWAGLTLAIAYATEAHLFITDMNQSPFNVGTRLALEEFTLPQVEDLNRRHGSPLKDSSEISRFFRLLNGQPYLVRRGLHEMVAHGMDIAKLEAQADRDEGIYGDHLRRILISLAKDPGLCDELREVLASRPCPSPDGFYRLRSAGVISGSSQQEAKPRCQIYATYLARHLL